MIQEGLTVTMTTEQILEREGVGHAGNEGQSNPDRGKSMHKTEPDCLERAD